MLYCQDSMFGIVVTVMGKVKVGNISTFWHVLTRESICSVCNFHSCFLSLICKVILMLVLVLVGLGYKTQDQDSKVYDKD